MVGISVTGGAYYVVKAVEYANQLGCVTVGITSNEDSLLYKIVKFPIFTDMGAEVITCSTRLKAGTAQKLVLNMITTIMFIKCGCVYENMMVNLKATNVKLKTRVISIVKDILNCSKQEAIIKLEENEWSILKVIGQ